MAFTPTEWADGEAGETPITAAELNRIEQGVAEAQNPAAVTWATISGKPATFPPALGTTATTALAGSTPLLALGTTATTAAAGNHTQGANTVSVVSAGTVTGATVQLALEALAARVAALEAAP